MSIPESFQAALSDRYAIERELGAGGMATVYLARDLKHHRRVAIKVLAPELGAALGPERFLAEIRIAANLQHPHLLPLFDSGEADGRLYYVMPYVAGESLRQRLEREQQLPIDETVRIATALSSALDYAHKQGVVHRDIKPENILLQAGEPLLADFGIALAVSAAGGERMTGTGLSLGTPQYMSPEQATGDRPIDARSDVYSLAAVTYEMLTGEPPHGGRTAQAVVARVLTESPRSACALRETVPAQLDAAVLRGLAKLPADRFATAGEFARALVGERAGTEAEAGGPYGPQDRTPVRATATVSSLKSPPTRKRVTLAGVAALTLLGIGAAGMLLSDRVRGSSPASLAAQGIVGERDLILVAEFEGRGVDPFLPTVVADALRTDLAQSDFIRVLTSQEARDILYLMRRPEVLLDVATARELARREGIPVVITGEVGAAGDGFVLTAAILSAATGEMLFSDRQSAARRDEVIPAIDRLSKTLRAHIGESLGSINRAPPLARATTSSLEALTLYTEAVEANSTRDFDRAIGLLERAVAIDSTFAVAWTVMGTALSNRGDHRSRQIEAHRNAYQLRDRVSGPERDRIEAYYAAVVEGDLLRYRDILREMARQSPIGVSNDWGLAERLLGNYAEAERILKEVVTRMDRPALQPYFNLTYALFNQRKLDEAFDIVEEWEQTLPSTGAIVTRSFLHLVLFDFAAADPLEPIDRARSLVAQGRLREATEYNALAADAQLLRGLIGAALEIQLRAAVLDLVFRDDPGRALARIGEILESAPWDSVPGPDRPFISLAILYAFAGQSTLARQVLEEYDSLGAPSERALNVGALREVEAWIALAEDRPDAAVDIARRAAVPNCATCGLLPLGRAYERLGQPGQAIAALEHYLNTPHTGSGHVRASIKLSRSTFEMIALLGDTYERLAALHEQQGNVDQARQYLSKVVELWEGGDPEVQPRVAAARGRLEALAAELPARGS
jgi:tetratricopeptide (TPR) repeat protein/tRNA A-37 threonylcarbamoyl transferase component Bud32